MQLIERAKVVFFVEIAQSGDIKFEDNAFRGQMPLFFGILQQG